MAAMIDRKPLIAARRPDERGAQGAVYDIIDANWNRPIGHIREGLHHVEHRVVWTWVINHEQAPAKKFPSPSGYAPSLQEALDEIKAAWAIFPHTTRYQPPVRRLDDPTPDRIGHGAWRPGEEPPGWHAMNAEKAPPPEGDGAE